MLPQIHGFTGISIAFQQSACRKIWRLLWDPLTCSTWKGLVLFCQEVQAVLLLGEALRRNPRAGRGKLEGLSPGWATNLSVAGFGSVASEILFIWTTFWISPCWTEVKILPRQVPVLAPTRFANRIFVCGALLAAKALCRCVRRQSLFLFPFSEQKGWEVLRVQFGKSRKYKSGLQRGKAKPSVPGLWLVIFFSLRQIHYQGVLLICRLREASTACCWYGKVVQLFVICVVWCICLWRQAAVPP